MAIKIPPSSRTQEAIDTPFEPNRNPGFGGVPSGIESEDVQNAIEEAKRDAIENDRYVVFGSYGGNANVGRYLEFFPGTDSFEAPVFLPVSSKLLGVVTATTAVDATCTIGFFDLTVSDVVPVYTITFTAQKRVVNTGTPAVPLYVFPVGAQVAVRVTSGSINKPHMYFFVSTG